MARFVAILVVAGAVIWVFAAPQSRHGAAWRIPLVGAVFYVPDFSGAGAGLRGIADGWGR